MTKTRVVASLIATGAALAALLLLLRTPAPVVPAEPPPVAPAPAPAAAPAPDPRPEAVPAPIPDPDRRESLLYRPVPEEVKQRVLSLEEVQERLVEVERQERATLRFSNAVDEGRFAADQMHGSVIALFDTVELDPVLDENAMMEGLGIRALLEESPLRRAGFAVGDVITSINDTPLHDPADLPTLLVRLERELDLCADRQGKAICRRLSLD